MAQAATDERQPDAVEAVLNYAIDTGEKPVNETMAPGDLRRRVTGVGDPRTVTLRNGRPLRDSFSLDANGFVFVDHRTAVQDFFDPAQLRDVYFPECEALVKRCTGASRVVIFDHTLRSGDEATREEKLIREPVKRVHNDYTDWSGPQRVRDILPDEAEALLQHRFAIVQVWRAINRPIRRNPLAVSDASTLAPGDLIASERRFPDRVGETYRVAYNPAHQWYYFPEMARDEALVFKVYDSATDGRARFTAHTSFDDPTSPAGAPARESIEIRSFAFFAPR